LEPDIDPIGIGLVPAAPSDDDDADPTRLLRERRVFISGLGAGFKEDQFFSKILARPDHYAKFHVDEAECIHFPVRRLALMYSERHLSDGLAEDNRPAPTFIEAVISHAHETLGHIGNYKTATYVRRFFWWASLAQDVTDFCKSCATCPLIKYTTGKQPGIQRPLDVPLRPFEHVGCYFMTGLPESEDEDGQVYDAICSITCHLTSFLVSIKCRSTDTGADFANRFKRHFVVHFGIPSHFSCDRDPKFMAGFFRALAKLSGILVWPPPLTTLRPMDAPK